MKIFYLTGSIIFTALILVLGFENVGANCSNINFLFYSMQSNPTVIIFGVAIIGMIAGILYHAFFSKLMETTPEDDDASFE